jgi:hypothetical protein
MKSKRIITILLSLAIMLTFMPAMAFATTGGPDGLYGDGAATEGKWTYVDPVDQQEYEMNYKWDADYSGVTIGKAHFPAVRQMANGDIEFDGEDYYVDEWDGLMEAYLDLSEASEADQQMYGSFVDDHHVYYYDLDFATPGIVYDEDDVDVVEVLKNSYTQASFEEFYTEDSAGEWGWDIDDTFLVFAVPNYVDKYEKLSKTAIKAAVSSDGVGYFNWTATLGKVDYKHGAETDQTLSVKTTVDMDEYTATTGYAADIKGTVPAKSITVSGKTMLPRDAGYYFDSTNNKWNQHFELGTADVVTFYDGAPHTIVADPVPDWTLQYSVYNSATSKYEDVDAVTLTDVNVNADFKTEDVKVKATYKQGTIKKEFYFTVNLIPATAFYSFDTTKSVTDPVKTYDTYTEEVTYIKDGKTYTDKYTMLKPGTAKITNINFATSAATFDPLDYVAYGPLTATYIGWTTSKYNDEELVVERAREAAGKAAIAANETELKGYLSEGFEVKQTPSLANPNEINLKLQKKTLTLDETKAFLKKYAKVATNISIYPELADTAKMTINYGPANTKDDDISFTGQTKYVYSGKKTTKKGVLKAKKTITVKATADSGNKITYVATKTAGGKIKVSKAGKITVKKGLKKGTYKVTVKAKTAAGNGFKAAKEKQTYTIVIKK